MSAGATLERHARQRAAAAVVPRDVAQSVDDDVERRTEADACGHQPARHALDAVDRDWLARNTAAQMPAEHDHAGERQRGITRPHRVMRKAEMSSERLSRGNLRTAGRRRAAGPARSTASGATAATANRDRPFAARSTLTCFRATGHLCSRWAVGPLYGSSNATSRSSMPGANGPVTVTRGPFTVACGVVCSINEVPRASAGRSIMQRPADVHRRRAAHSMTCST